MNTPATNLPEITVSDLSNAIKRTVEDAFGFVRVRGEVSGFRGASPSGHVYFRLKDQNAVIEAVIWKGVYGRIAFKPQEGLEVIATGRVTTFPGSSKYQIVIETLEPAGVGALMALLEERRKKLAAEGLFDAARKKPLPFLPAVIGVVTSPTGAVIRDILHRLADRFPRQVLVWPVRVQGEGSAQEVARAIAGFNAIGEDDELPRPDVIIVARGGGSLEDLWGFNEEIVVRAAAASRIPLISAVGHETDTTLIDFASDRRAPTPTAAAEMAVPVRLDLVSQCGDLARRQREAMARIVERRRDHVRALSRALPEGDRLLDLPRQRLDALAARLPKALAASAMAHRQRLTRAEGRLSPALLSRRVAQERERVAVLYNRSSRALGALAGQRRQRLDGLAVRHSASLRALLRAARLTQDNNTKRLAALWPRAPRALEALITRRKDRLTRADNLLSALSYKGVLARGYAYVTGEDGAPLRLAAQVNEGERLTLHFADGTRGAVADGAKPPEAPRAKTPPRPKGGGGGQGSLF